MEIQLKIDRAEGSTGPVWSCGLEIYDGRHKDHNYPPPKATFFASGFKWHSLWVAKDPEVTQTTYNLSFGNSPKKGDKQVVTVRFVGHGCGAAIAHGAVHQYYEYTFQP